MADFETLNQPAVNGTNKASGVASFALNAMNSQVGRAAEILNSAADSVDKLLGGSDSPLPDSAKSMVSSTSQKLRDLADRTTEDEARKLIETLQKSAASHPAATAGIGAALGAALGLALAKLGQPRAATASFAKKQNSSPSPRHG